MLDRFKSRPINMAEVLSELPEAEIETIMRISQDRKCARGTYVYELGGHQPDLYLVKKGLVEEFRLTEGGSKLPLGRIVSGLGLVGGQCSQPMGKIFW